MNATMIAPCGMNCALCYAHLRVKNSCGGCRSKDDINMPAYCQRCIIRSCEARSESESDFCYVCESYPCKRLKALDKRYRTKYAMSMMDNLSVIKTKGMDAFLRQQSEHWTCQKCGGIICVHGGLCNTCESKK